MINVVLIGLGSLIGTCRAQTGVAGVAETKGQELMQHLQTLQGRAQAAEVRAAHVSAAAAASLGARSLTGRLRRAGPHAEGGGRAAGAAGRERGARSQPR